MMQPTAPAGKIRLAVQVPAGMVAGAMLRVAHAGRMYDVHIPPGVPPGGQFLMEVDAQPSGRPAPPPSIPMGLPVDDAPPASSPPPPPPDRPLERRHSSVTGRAIVEAQPRTQAESKAECPICFEPLCAAPVGVFLDARGKRVSQHFYNLEAAREWLRSGTGQCPLTRARIASVLEVPDIRNDPEAWFRAVDVDGDNKLSRIEVVECLKAQLPLDAEALDAAAVDPDHWMWAQWDLDGSGYIERSELMGEQGLAAYVREAFQRAERGEGAIPDIRSDKEGWYDYWDEDRSGELDREEVVRALLKTLKLTSDQARVREMRSTVDAIWGVFDTDGGGTIDRQEFLCPDGLADTIIATM